MEDLQSRETLGSLKGRFALWGLRVEGQAGRHCVRPLSTPFRSCVSKRKKGLDVTYDVTARQTTVNPEIVALFGKRAVEDD